MVFVPYSVRIREYFKKYPGAMPKAGKVSFEKNGQSISKMLGAILLFDL